MVASREDDWGAGDDPADGLSRLIKEGQMDGNRSHVAHGREGAPPIDYRLSLTMRIVVILLVVVAAILTTLGVLPLARLLGVDPQHLQGAGFRPTFGTMTVGILYSVSQFVLIWLAMRFVHRRPFISLGFRRPFWRFLLVGSAVGVGLAVAEIGTNCLIGGGVSIAWNVPPETSVGSVVGYFLLWFLFLLTLNSLKEELVFRTYPIEQFNDHPRAIRISAFLSRFSIALLFAYAYYRWRSIWLVVGIHNGTNFVGFLLGGHWKSGGLFELDYQLPSSETRIVVDLVVKLLGLAIIHWVWRRSNAPAKTTVPRER